MTACLCDKCGAIVMTEWCTVSQRHQRITTALGEATFVGSAQWPIVERLLRLQWVSDQALMADVWQNKGRIEPPTAYGCYRVALSAVRKKMLNLGFGIKRRPGGEICLTPLTILIRQVERNRCRSATLSEAGRGYTEKVA